jgi:type I restriction enzyme S subunit
MQTVSGVGGSLLRARPSEVFKIRIPVPPMAEQERIVKLLAEADQLRKLRAQADARTASLIPALFHEMFGDVGNATSAWPRERLGQLATIEAVLVDPRDKAFQDLQHVGADRIERDSGKLLDSKSAKEDGLISSKFPFGERDVLYSKIRPNLRKVALPTTRGLCSADVYPVRPGKQLVREFLWAYLLTDHFTNRAIELSDRANMPKLNRVQLDSIEAPVPPLALQKQFAERVRAIHEFEARQSKSRHRIESLFQSMLYSAFGGGL